MNTTDDHLIDWIRSAAERIPVDLANTTGPSQFDLVCAEPTEQPTRRLTTGLLLVAAALLIIATAGIVLNRQTHRTTVASSQSVLNEPTPIPIGTPEPGQALPHIQDPPAWFGVPISAERGGGYRTGRWTTTAIGIGNTSIASPITISATDGTLRSIESAGTVTIDGRSYLLVESNGYRMLGTTTSPTLVAAGAVDTAILAEVLAKTTVTDTGGVLVLGLSELPTDYGVRVHPQVQAPDIDDRPTLANQAGDIAINEVSDWVDPQLSSANSGADYRQVSVNGEPAWTGSHDFNSFGTLRFLAWSPEPGVVFEITTASTNRTIEELIELAEASTVLPADEWHTTYPSPNDLEPVCPITQPTGPAFEPPAPWPNNPSDEEMVWFGNDGLWTALRTDGHTPRKSVWWSANFPGGDEEEQPELEVVYQQLHTNTDPVKFPSPGTNAFTNEDQWFMINGIAPDTTGCWRATATYKDATLSYVYKVN